MSAVAPDFAPLPAEPEPAGALPFDAEPLAAALPFDAALPFAETEIGYGQDPAVISAVRLPADFLAGYYDATHTQTISFVSGVRDADLAAIIDSRWDPPVTLGVRLVSVISDDLQHAGQAAFIRGIVKRR